MEFKKKLSQIQGRFRDVAPYETMVNWLNFFDKGSRGMLTIEEFLEAITKKGIRCTFNEIQTIYKAFDWDIENSQRINYIYFLDVMYGKKMLDVEKYVKEVRFRSGEDKGYTQEEVKIMQYQSINVTSLNGEGREQSENDLSIELGSVGRRSSDSNNEVAQLIDPSEITRNFEEIQKKFMDCFSFENLLMTLSHDKFAKEHQITLKQFEGSIYHFFGS